MPVGDGVKRRAHDADLKEMVVIRSPRSPLVPFKLHRFGQQRPCQPVSGGADDTSVGEISLKTGNNALYGEESA